MRKILQTYPLCCFFLAQKKLNIVFSFNFCTISVLLIFLTSFSTSKLRSQDFVTTWEVTAGETITLPNAEFTVVRPPATPVAAVYDFNIDWGDGTILTNQTTPLLTHTYATDGPHTVRISGTFDIFSFDAAPTASADKLLSVEEWGNISMIQIGFTNAIKFQLNTMDPPDLSRITSLRNLFSGAISFNTNIAGWDVSGIEDMSRTFTGATSFNQNIGNWQTQNVRDLSEMFANATAFNQDIGNWITEMVTDMNNMFLQATAFNQDIGDWNTQMVSNMRSMFAGAISFNQDISRWNVSTVQNMEAMFSLASAFNQDISGWTTTSLTTMDFIFSDAAAFNHSLGNWDISGVPSMFGFKC